MKGWMRMSCFNSDGTGFNEQASVVDETLSTAILDDVVTKAFQDGMTIDEIMYVTQTHTERVLRRALVQWQLKNAANKNN